MKATAALLNVVAEEVLRQGMQYGQMALLDEPHLNATLNSHPTLLPRFPYPFAPII
jgi:hypothetical protein